MIVVQDLQNPQPSSSVEKRVLTEVCTHAKSWTQLSCHDSHDCRCQANTDLHLRCCCQTYLIDDPGAAIQAYKGLVKVQR